MSTATSGFPVAMLRSFLPRWALLVCSALVAGCNDTPRHTIGGGTPSTATPPLNEAERILARMVEAYGKADSYADRGELRIEFRREGTPYKSTVPFSVMLERPNKVRLHLYQGSYVCDGKHAWGWTEDLPGYLLKRPAPSTITLGEIYADKVMRTVLSGGQAGSSLQLEMLLGVDAMDLLRAGGERPELLSDDYAGGAVCRRVRVRRGDGDLVYWIDRDALTLRRIDFPTRRLARMMAAASPPTDVQFIAEFIEPQLNPKIPSLAFDFAPPEQVKIVDQLDAYVTVSPPPPLSVVLGTKPSDFAFTTLEGAVVSQSSLRGKTAIIVFWSLDDGYSMQALADVSAAAERLHGRGDVAFLTVNIDPDGEIGVRDEELREVFRRNNLALPVARDAGHKHLATFDVQGVPSLFILGPDGVVQDNEVGLNPKLESELAARIESVVAGKSIVSASRQRYADRLRKFEQSQQAVAGAAESASSLPKATIAPAAPPKALKMTTLWKCANLKQPGVVLATEEKGDASRIVVADGLRAVAELDADGKVLRRVELDLPKAPSEAVISFWRTAVDAGGKRYFVGSAGAQQQLHLFDGEFKRLLSFPEGTHSGIADVQMADLDGDGKPELLVGYWGVVGVQCVSLEGSRIWSNRKLPENILRLAATGVDASGRRSLLAVSGRMTVAVLDHQGIERGETFVDGRPARLVAAADLTGDGRAEFCAVTSESPGADVAVGFDETGKELWHYALPPGVQPVPEMQNEMVVGGRLLRDGAGQWIFVGADGTIHLVAADGKPIDAFAWGDAIHGLAIATIGGRPALVVSDSKNVTAVRLER